jgi:hypothetical protein
VYANGKFVIAGGEGVTQTIYSTDGKNWITGSITDVQAGLYGITSFRISSLL